MEPRGNARFRRRAPRGGAEDSPAARPAGMEPPDRLQMSDQQYRREMRRFEKRVQRASRRAARNASVGAGEEAPLLWSASSSSDSDDGVVAGLHKQHEEHLFAHMEEDEDGLVVARRRRRCCGRKVENVHAVIKVSAVAVLLVLLAASLVFWEDIEVFDMRLARWIGMATTMLVAHLLSIPLSRAALVAATRVNSTFQRIPHFVESMAPPTVSLLSAVWCLLVWRWLVVSSVTDNGAHTLIERLITVFVMYAASRLLRKFVVANVTLAFFHDTYAQRVKSSLLQEFLISNLASIVDQLEANKDAPGGDANAGTGSRRQSRPPDRKQVPVFTGGKPGAATAGAVAWGSLPAAAAAAGAAAAGATDSVGGGGVEEGQASLSPPAPVGAAATWSPGDGESPLADANAAADANGADDAGADAADGDEDAAGPHDLVMRSLFGGTSLGKLAHTVGGVGRQPSDAVMAPPDMAGPAAETRDEEKGRGDAGDGQAAGPDHVLVVETSVSDDAAATLGRTPGSGDESASPAQVSPAQSPRRRPSRMSGVAGRRRRRRRSRAEESSAVTSRLAAMIGAPQSAMVAPLSRGSVASRTRSAPLPRARSRSASSAFGREAGVADADVDEEAVPPEEGGGDGGGSSTEEQPMSREKTHKLFGWIRKVNLGIFRVHQAEHGRAHHRASLFQDEMKSAGVLAKRIMVNLRQSPAQESLTLADFERVLMPEWAARAFALFDLDADSAVTLHEVKAGLRGALYDRRSLQYTLQDSERILSKLDTVLSVLFFMVLSFLVLVVFDVDLSQVLISLSSFGVLLAFGAGATVAETVNNVVFLFVAHAFDVGDRIEVDGQAYLVQRVNLTNVVLRTVDNQLVYYPTSQLRIRRINNWRRSGAQWHTLHFTVGVQTSTASIERLRDDIHEFLVLNSADFAAQYHLLFSSIRYSAYMDMELRVLCRKNFQDLLSATYLRSRILLLVKRVLEREGIEVLPPTQRVAGVEDAGVAAAAAATAAGGGTGVVGFGDRERE